MPHFNVMFTYQGTTKVILLGSTQDANYATIVLDAARSRLLQAQVRGELELVRHNGERQTLLREALNTSETGAVGTHPRESHRATTGPAVRAG